MYKLTPQDLINQLTDARARTCALIEQLSEEQLMGPRLPTINPLRWEIGHTAYFYEYWVLRQHYKEAPIIPDIDELFDSIHIPHESRWDLKLPTLHDTIQYMQAVKDRVVQHLSNDEQDNRRDYLVQYAIFHEDMHCEAFTYTRQILEYPIPNIAAEHTDEDFEKITGDVCIPKGVFKLGAPHSDQFIFDNEKWEHEQTVSAFKISRVAVSNEEFQCFVDEGGYEQSEFWCDEGWQWRLNASLKHPIYWRKGGNQSAWQIRWFDTWQDMQPDSAVVNVSWYEAIAYCRWAKRRLPTELEWEVAAAAVPEKDNAGIKDKKNYYPWGDSEYKPNFATLNGQTLGPANVSAKPQGDSAFGCRQMLGNVWEWTSTTFSPYPEFTPDMYQDYSQPLFGKTKVLRGGCWATRSRLLRNTLRNYYAPGRNDIFAGFRTCAID